MIAVLCVLTSLLPGFGDTSGDLKLRLEMLDGSTKDVVPTEIRGNRLAFDSGRQHLELDALSSITPLGLSAENAPAPGPQRFYLADGGQVDGRLVEFPGAPARMIRIDIGLPKPFDLSLTVLRAIRFGAVEEGAAEKELQSHLANRPSDKDLLIVGQDEKAVVLPGALERLTPQGWEFTVGRKTQKQGFDAAYAVVLGGMTGESSTTTARVVVTFRPENRLVGQILEADRQRVDLQTAQTEPLSIPWERIVSIVLRSSRVIYLSELTPLDMKSSSVLDVDFPPRRNSSVTGSPLAIRGQSIVRGIGMHARSQMSYKLDAQFDRLLATIGIDDDAAPVGSAVFRVLGDGKVLFESPVLRRDDPPKQINVPLNGARTITLECDDGGDSDVADHCDWGEVRLLAASAVH